MATIINHIETFFKQNSILSKLIIINVSLFLLFKILIVTTTLFNVNFNLMTYLELPSSLSLLIRRPWSLVSYMFLHYDFLHILFNMLWLYWFGKIFLIFFNSKQLGGLYVLGGIAGAVFFLLAYNIFPYFKNTGVISYLIGASASVMAIVFGVSFYRKDFAINLLFIGRIKIIYVAIFSLILDILALTSGNAGGHFAHIGGALTGIAFGYYYKKGTDITSWINNLIDNIVSITRKKPSKMKVKYSNDRFNSEYEYNKKKNEENIEIDHILDKIKKSGYSSLSKEEKKKLFDASKK